MGTSAPLAGCCCNLPVMEVVVVLCVLYNGGKLKRVCPFLIDWGEIVLWLYACLLVTWSAVPAIYLSAYLPGSRMCGVREACSAYILRGGPERKRGIFVLEGRLVLEQYHMPISSKSRRRRASPSSPWARILRQCCRPSTPWVPPSYR